MSNLADLLEAHVRLVQDMEALKSRFENTFRPGKVIERDHEKGVRLDLGVGADGKPVKSDWIQPTDASGVTRYLPREGEQGWLIAPNGDQGQGMYVALTHSDAKKNPAPDGDTTVHFNRDGRDHRTRQGKVSDQADKMHKRFVGQDPGEGNLVHELNKQLAGLRAAVTQNAHTIAGLHDATSKLRQVLQPRNPEVAALIPLLNGDAKSLEAAVKGVTGKLQDYLGSAVKMAVDKLKNSLLGGLMGVIIGALNGQIGGLIGQVSDLVEGGGLDGAAHAAASTLVDEMRGLAAKRRGRCLGPDRGPARPARGIARRHAPRRGARRLARANHRRARRGRADDGGLGDMLDGQVNLTKGVTKHYKLGAE